MALKLSWTRTSPWPTPTDRANCQHWTDKSEEQLDTALQNTKKAYEQLTDNTYNDIQLVYGKPIKQRFYYKVHGLLLTTNRDQLDPASYHLCKVNGHPLFFFKELQHDTQ
jgi:hypothetical protein